MSAQGKVDVEAIRAIYDRGQAACAGGDRETREVCSALLVARTPGLCSALEHERRVSAAWRAFAKAHRDITQAITVALFADAQQRLAAAENDLRALGEDPEAP